MGILQKDIDDFHATIKARALLILIEWAGNQNKLAKKLNLSRYAVQTWIKRGGVSPPSAWALAQLPGVPLKPEEIRPDIKDWSRYSRFKRAQFCPRCWYNIGLRGLHTPTFTLYKGDLKAAKKHHLQPLPLAA